MSGRPVRWRYEGDSEDQARPGWLEGVTLSTRAGLDAMRNEYVVVRERDGASEPRVARVRGVTTERKVGVELTVATLAWKDRPA